MADVGQENDNYGHTGSQSRQIPVSVPLHVADLYTVRWELSCKLAAQTTFLSSNMPVPYNDITHAPMPKMQYGLHLIESQQLGIAEADQLLPEFYTTLARASILLVATAMSQMQ